MKKFLTIAVALFAFATMFTSCEETIITTCYAQYVEGSTNYTSNIFLQILVGKEVRYNAEDSNTYFYGDQKEAVDWFNQKMDKMETKEFVSGIPVMDNTTATFELIGAESKVLATRTVTFYTE